MESKSAKNELRGVLYLRWEGGRLAAGFDVPADHRSFIRSFQGRTPTESQLFPTHVSVATRAYDD